jgi:CheY-like chemotaxis protein
VRLADVDPDLVLADVSLPGKSGYELCSYIKNHPSHRHARVVLMAGAMEPVDEAEAGRAGSDGILRKPFEASVMIEIATRLAAEAGEARSSPPPEEAPPAAAVEETPAREAAVLEEPVPAARLEVDAEAVRASVTLALEAALPVLIDEITQRVVEALAVEEGASGAQ